MILSQESLSTKQQGAISRLCTNDHTLLVAPTGAGKTAICLTAIKNRVDDGSLKRVIVAAPAKVVETGVWAKEAAKWAHLSGLTVVEVKGDPQERLHQLKTEGGVYIISLNNLDWLLQQDHRCDGIIVDELSKAAGKQAAGLKSNKKAGMFKWRVGMTATPVSQNFEKLYAMCRIIDGGAALGTNKQKYLEQYFYSDYMGYNWTLRDGADAQIMARIGGLVHLVDDTKADTLPPCTKKFIRFEMPLSSRDLYNDMKRHLIVSGVEAANEAVKSGKLRQIASGFMYDADEEVHYLDGARVTAAARWCDALKGKPGLIFYEYVEQGNRLSNFVGSNIKLAQINAMSHGVDGLQHTYADVLFYHPIWSRDATEQAVGRVWRQGQTKPVTVTTLICNDTLDDLVINRVDDRGEWMKIFSKHLKGE